MLPYGSGGETMKDGFIKVAAATPVIRLADCRHNAEVICGMIDEAEKAGVKVLCFPELCLTGYTCGDLFLQDTLLRDAFEQLAVIVRSTAGKDIFTVVSLPLQVNSKLYITAAAIQNGKLLGLSPKHFLPNYAEFYDSRHFMPGAHEIVYIDFFGEKIPFGMDMLYENREMPYLVIGTEICEDLWMPQPPSGNHVVAGATLILNPSASDELAGKREYRRDLVRNQSARLVCGYIYADAGEGESTTDLCFSGHNLIVENGVVLKESELFSNGLTICELDLNRLVNERRRMTSYQSHMAGYTRIGFSFEKLGGQPVKTEITRHIARSPFIPEDPAEAKCFMREIIAIQAHGLMARLKCIGCTKAIIGISGGLDSTLAYLITVEAFKKLGLDPKGIIAVTMPCFGTSDRTYRNAHTLMQRCGSTLMEINIRDAVLRHFEDIGQDPECHDVTFENAQARERTQILMDLANKYGGIVIGTGDLSELALGFATYNGDHMSMYGVNASVPKTLVRALVRYIAEESEDAVLREALIDITETPVSPELLPAKDGQTAQITEDIVGPYELHDFFIFYMIRYGFSPSKIYRLAQHAFEGVYTDETILKWMKSFYKRFFAQQYKRSCLPDGPKVGSVSLSPRGDWRMPSDVQATGWMRELAEL